MTLPPSFPAALPELAHLPVLTPALATPPADRTPRAVVIGGGPAGLMAADVLSAQGVVVDLYDAMPSVGRKFLLAGIGGLNITHAEPYARFCSRYAAAGSALQPLLDDFTPDALRAWVHGLGVDTFVGSSGRVFPKEMKAAPLLRAWLHHLRQQGVRLHVRHRWLGWTASGALRVQAPAGELQVPARCTVLALGGASWPQLGSDGAWVPLLQARNVPVQPLESANCGFEVAWSAHLRDRFAGAPVKPVAVSLAGAVAARQGEFVITAHGVEGSLIYAVSRDVRARIRAEGQATLLLDLLPAHDAERVLREVAHPRGARSLSSHLQSRLGLGGVKTALLHEVLPRHALADATLLAQGIKALPIVLQAARPLAEAISTAGGVAFAGLDTHLMVADHPGLFVAGEMLDWDAPTGGYLLTACLASGRWAGQGAARWLSACGGSMALPD